jgi:hypothetical protein
VYAFTEADGKLDLRYSPTPVVMPISVGSYIECDEPPTPTPGTFADLEKAIADLEKGTIKELDVVDLSTCESGVYLTNKITYKKPFLPQPFTEMIPNKALLIVVKNEVGIQFQWIGSAYILSGLSNAEGLFEDVFIEYEFSRFATKDYVNELIGNIESGGSASIDENGIVTFGGNTTIDDNGIVTL